MVQGRARLAASAVVLAACVGASALLHALILVLSWSESAPRQPMVKRTTLRLSQRLGNPQLPEARLAASTPAPLELNLHGEGASIEAALPILVLALEAAALPPGPLLPLLPAGAWDAYVPRPLLTKPPQALDSVLLAWPDFRVEQTHFEAVAALYIDEAGVVQALSVKQGQLPAPLLEAARRAFEGRRFLPGELNGQAVKARIYVEIMFDQPEPPKPAGRGVSQ